MSIGGYVKVDAGYVTQAGGPAPAGLEAYFPDRNNANGNTAPSNAVGSFAMGTGQTALTFLVKGPDAWGAKTSAFIKGMFAGQTTNPVRRGRDMAPTPCSSLTWTSTGPQPG